MTAYRVTAHRVRGGSRIQLALPAALSHALPGDDALLFEASFVNEGILLKYLGPKQVGNLSRGTEPTPKWAK